MGLLQELGIRRSKLFHAAEAFIDSQPVWRRAWRPRRAQQDVFLCRLGESEPWKRGVGFKQCSAGSLP